MSDYDTADYGLHADDMYDSYTSDAASTLFDDEMQEEGRMAEQDTTADSVQELYDILKHDGHPYDAIMEMITDTLKVDNPEQYL